MGTSNLYGTKRKRLVLPVSPKPKQSLRRRPPAREDRGFRSFTSNPPAPKPISIISVPEYARVYVDNELSGKTPLEVKPESEKDVIHIRISKKGYRSMHLEAIAGDKIDVNLERY